MCIHIIDFLAILLEIVRHKILSLQVLEEIRAGLELNEYGMQQQRIAFMRFLGELYNYELVESSVIFDTLYLILSFGHGTTEVWSC